MKTKKTTGENIANGLLAAGLAIALTAIVAGGGVAEAAEGEGKLTLVATQAGGPAMQAVSWVVLAKDGTLVAKTPAHSQVLDLPAGTYTATLECNGKRRSDTATLFPNGAARIVMACN